MRKRVLSFISAILAIVMLAGALAACGGKTPEQTTEKPAEKTTEKQTEAPTESSATEKPTETDPVESTEQPTEAVTEPPVEEETGVTPKIESPYIDTIVLANNLANGIQQYYAGVTAWAPTNGKACIIENQQIKMQINRDKTTKDQYIEYIANKDGGVYIEKTMDVYIKMNGQTYYLSKTTNNVYTNVWKHGYYYHEVRMERMNFANDAGERVESLQVARIYHAYSDKLHHELQVCSADVDTTGIDVIGFITELAVDKVAAIQIRDASGIHSTLDGVDFATVEYVGFDVKGVGIFGYILPNDATTGSIKVEEKDGKYVIIQERVPENGTIKPGNNEVLNGNDFRMGQRLYTDTTHDFAALDREAYIERNPLTARNIKVSTVYSDGGEFGGYNALRGSYFINLYYKADQNAYIRQNQNFEANFDIKGDDYDRTIYMVVADDGGHLECAVVLDDKLMSLPIPVQVGKNFSGDGDEKNLFIDKDSNVTAHNLFWYADVNYSEAIFPISVKAEDAKEYSVIHLYHNWGNFPLQQISYIHFWVPYYHLSTGVYETNCIYYVSSNVDMLPDHRGMSSPDWSNGAAHTSAGQHLFFRAKYTPSDKSAFGLNTIDRYITSYGPTYSEIEMHMLSDDGKIKATYTHMEMPQEDENRGYYTMVYEFLEDTDVKNFKELVSLYYVYSRDNTGEYAKFGYLNEKNKTVVADFKADGETYYHTLGDKSPYFDLFYMPTYSGSGGPGYVNTSFLIKDYEVIIAGEKQDVPFVIVEKDNTIGLTLDMKSARFKKGDTITIHAIIMPWGSENSDYSGKNYAPDQNVLDVRENTLLNPIQITAGQHSEVIENTFIPMVRSTNGTSAEFTIFGGKKNAHTIPERDEGYNVTVRAYGFEKLTAPKIYELKDGEWVEYEIWSKNNPDVLGYTNEYDGYAVHYDEDGTVSYSFVIDMTAAKYRTFKIETDYEFEGFKRIETVEKVLYPYLFMLDEKKISSAAQKYSFFMGFSSGEDKGVRYTGIHGTPYNEAYIIVDDRELQGCVTGQYIIIKYRIPEDNPEPTTFLQVYSSTKYSTAMGNGDDFLVESAFEPDGEWHVLVIDTLAEGYAAGPGQYVLPDDEGNIILQHMRLDIFNYGGGVSKDTRWEISYVATHNNLDEILAANTDMDYVMISTGRYEYTKIDPKTGEIIEKY